MFMLVSPRPDSNSGFKVSSSHSGLLYATLAALIEPALIPTIVVSKAKIYFFKSISLKN